MWKLNYKQHVLPLFDWQLHTWSTKKGSIIMFEIIDKAMVLFLKQKE